MIKATGACTIDAITDFSGMTVTLIDLAANRGQARRGPSRTIWSDIAMQAAFNGVTTLLANHEGLVSF
jgi:hypothetical protein